ncbi:MAG: hypothetical protein PW734_07255 [Verrucomicrobium sp.]|nr:hypothetical protein [Verrucomicrobium sp.]
MKIPFIHELNLLKDQVRQVKESTEQIRALAGQTREEVGWIQEKMSRTAASTAASESLLRQIQLYLGNDIFKNHLARLHSSEFPKENEIGANLAATVKSLRFRTEPAPDRSRTVVCTVAVGEEYREKVAPCLESHRRYCRDHGYDYIDMEMEPNWVHRPLSWYKLPLLFRLMQAGYERLLVIDADAMITNPSVRLEPFFERLDAEGKAMLAAEEDGGVNCGVFFLRKCPQAVRLLDLMWLHDMDVRHGHWEQRALRELLNNYRAVHDVLAVADGRAFNSFPPERVESFSEAFDQRNSWQPGDFICHFSGIRGDRLPELIRQYAAR